jgi:hypothetical protein
MNPYEAPQSIVSQPQLPELSFRQLALFGCCLGAGLGVLTNTINGFVGQDYFRIFMNYQEQIFFKAILHGIIEGGLYGLLNSILFWCGVKKFHHGRADIQQLKRYFFWLALIVFGMWLLGGFVAAFLLKSQQPLIIQELPILQGKVFLEPTGFWWCLGSLNLAVASSPFCTLIMLVLYLYRNRQAPRQ